MENHSSKKKEERRLLNSFRVAYEDFPKGKVIESESPDFIIKPNRKRTIGIELIQILSRTKESEITRNAFLDNIENAILKKEEKLKRYQKKVLETYWLIITIERKIPSNFNIPKILDRLKIESKFDQIFLFDNIVDKVYQIGS